MQIVSHEFREQAYSGEALYNCNLIINNNNIPVSQIASIKIDSPIIDTSVETLYIGTFISQKLTIKFKNLDGLDIKSNYEVYLEIGQYLQEDEGERYENVPIGHFIIDDLAENYQETCEITCMDYAIKFKPNIDYSPCFTNGVTTVDTIARYICDYFGVEIADMPSINGDIIVSTYDNTISGKQWLSYIAEIKGCNLKINRDGKLLFTPFVKKTSISINALESEEFELGEEYSLSRIVYFDAIRNFTYGKDTENTLFIRQDNPFVVDTNVVKNLYDKYLVKNIDLEKNIEFEIDNGDSSFDANINLFGNTYQYRTTGKNLFDGETELGRYDDTTGEKVETSSSRRNVNPIYVKPNTTYIFSNNGDGLAMNVYEYKEDTTFIKHKTIAINSSFTTDTNTKYINISRGVDLATLKVQLEEGTTATKWEEYTGGTASPNPDYPQNIEVVTGYNKIDVVGKNLFSGYEDGYVNSSNGNNEAQTGAHRSYYIKVKPNKTYIMTFGCTRYVEYDENKKFIKNTILNTNTPYTITNSPTTEYVRLAFNNSVSTTKIDNFMYVLGETLGEYEPYQGQNYEINLGKNLLDINNLTFKNGYYSSTGVWNTANNNGTLEFINVLPNTTYTFSINENVANFSICEFDKTTFVTRSLVYANKNKTFTTSETTNKISLTINKDSSTIITKDIIKSYQPQLEKGGNATSFSPYFTPIELCEIGDYQDYIYKENGNWYKHCEIRKLVFDGSENWNYNSHVMAIPNNYVDNFLNYSNGGKCYSSHFIGNALDNTINTNLHMWIGNSSFVNTYWKDINSLSEWKQWLQSNNVEMYYILRTPTTEIITNEELIEQLNALENIKLLNGYNHIYTETNNLEPYLKLNYDIQENFSIWSLKTKNYGDISLDAWDIIQYNLGEESYLTYNNNIITYEMTVMSEINCQIPTKQKEITTNVIGGDDPTKIRMIKTRLDYINNIIELLVQETSGLTERTNQLVLDILSTQNIFQITGGSNLIQNSQFLFDDVVWNFYNVDAKNIYYDDIPVTYDEKQLIYGIANEETKYHTPLGEGYDGTLAGFTTASSKIKLRNIVMDSTKYNIVGLKTNIIHTLNYSYRQDALTSTRVQLIERISGNSIFDVTYNKETKNFTNETFQFVAEESDYIFRVTTITTSGNLDDGYFYLYDLMLNSGDKKNWEPAATEVSSTVIKMSELGLQVIAAGSKIVTLMTAQGFQVRKYANGKIGEIITDFTNKGIITGDIESESISTGKYMMTEVQINNKEHHVEYFIE